MIHGAISKTTRHTLHIITLYYDLVVNNNDIATTTTIPTKNR
ncbi:hypothetical protein N644_1911 [Lactiplantibacillus paraplantarum]|uniref:Uncharacterized protein n=1 Tax=Lactiplantibacillus paraplantarum TaxID=60520 RepID=A0ABQ0N6F1_9LACO|nr:hypothetical protein N644_1911 [Lactiplantibacillus paraplantarum]GBF00678.1 hypothetical protein LPPLD21_00179 [Lactiplantibacillus paraplantarum]